MVTITIHMHYWLYITLAVSMCAAIVFFGFIVAGKDYFW